MGIELTGAIEANGNGTSLSSAAAKPLPRSLVASPAPSASGSRASPMDLMSPPEGSSARAPVNSRSKRNPWTLFINQLPVPVSEDEIKAFFGPAGSNVRGHPPPICFLRIDQSHFLMKIISVKIPINHYNRQQKAVAFVEFRDKDAMEYAISGHHEASIAHPKAVIECPYSCPTGITRRPPKGYNCCRSTGRWFARYHSGVWTWPWWIHAGGFQWGDARTWGWQRWAKYEEGGSEVKMYLNSYLGNSSVVFVTNKRCRVHDKFTTSPAIPSRSHRTVSRITMYQRDRATSKQGIGVRKAKNR